MGAESDRVATFGRLDLGLRQASDWYLWGPYLSERQWGTVREDYSESGDAWDYLSHDQARSRCYRWGEDGLAGWSDIEGRLCLGLALWNGRDAILKERIFGLTSTEGNHGEDAKEYWWFLDAVPSHVWNRWRYHYPQNPFPYDDLVAESQRRGKLDPEYELLDTGVFDDDRYWVVEVHYAKDTPHDTLMTVQVTNAGPDPDTLHVLPTAWFRNTWSWTGSSQVPTMTTRPDGAVAVEHPVFGDLELHAQAAAGASPQWLFCDNETNTARLFGTDPAGSPPYPKDGINDHVVSGAATVNPQGSGTKCSAWYQLTVQPGETVEVHLRLRPKTTGTASSSLPDAFAGFAAVMAKRRAEADEFYADLTPAAASPDEAMVMRQAFGGLLWSKQLYAYNVARWLDGDPAQPTPPDSRRTGRNSRWRGFDAFDVMSMPDTWEYPWFAAWDLAFHTVALVHVDPAFAKYQLSVICREWFQHGNGALPAYEWDFGDVNPPVQAWAALEVFAVDGGTDIEFLSRIFDKLLVNFTWWVNREDSDGSNVFEGGFLGLDNIGPLDRSHLPPGWQLEQSDATGWMAMYSLAMATMAAVLQASGTRPALDLVQKFLEHFAQIRDALEVTGLWDDTDGLYYDLIRSADGQAEPVRVRSMVAMVPLFAVAVIGQAGLDQTLTVAKRFADALARRRLRTEGQLEEAGLLTGPPGERRMLVGVTSADHIRRLLGRLFDEEEFLSPYGLRSLSRYHREHPYTLEVGGIEASIDYEPAESTTFMFGGNSNWRGPVWFPINFLVVTALERYHRFFGDDFTIEYPTGSGQQLTLDAVADDLWSRLVGLFLRGPDGRRPAHGRVATLQDDPRWRDNILFFEYFHGDDGAGLGASHQTGWTGLVADVIRRRHRAAPSASQVLQDLAVRRVDGTRDGAGGSTR